MNLRPSVSRAIAYAAWVLIGLVVIGGHQWGWR